MDIKGTFTEDELVEYVGMRLKLNTIKNVLDSTEFGEQAKLLIIRGLMTEVKE